MVCPREVRAILAIDPGDYRKLEVEKSKPLRLGAPVPRHRGRAPRRWNLVRLGVGGNWTAHRRAGPTRAHGDPAPRQRHLRDGSTAPHAIWRRALTESGSPGGPPTEARVVREEGPRPGRRSTSFVWALASKPGVPQTSPTLFRRESRSGRRRRPGPPGGPSCGGLVRVRGQRRQPVAAAPLCARHGVRDGFGLATRTGSQAALRVSGTTASRAGVSGPVRGLRAGPGHPSRAGDTMPRPALSPPGRMRQGGPGLSRARRQHSDSRLLRWPSPQSKRSGQTRRLPWHLGPAVP